METMDEVNADPKLQLYIEEFAEALSDLVEDDDDC
jgi:hypothetical protein